MFVCARALTPVLDNSGKSVVTLKTILLSCQAAPWEQTAPCNSVKKLVEILQVRETE